MSDLTIGSSVTLAGTSIAGTVRDTYRMSASSSRYMGDLGGEWATVRWSDGFVSDVSVRSLVLA